MGLGQYRTAFILIIIQFQPIYSHFKPTSYVKLLNKILLPMVIPLLNYKKVNDSFEIGPLAKAESTTPLTAV